MTEVVEFLTWNARNERIMSVAEVIAVNVVLIGLVIGLIWAVAKFVTIVCDGFFTVHEWELNLIDDPMWLEKNPLCWRCERYGLYVRATRTERDGARIIGSVCDLHHKTPGASRNVSVFHINNGRIEEVTER